VRLKTGIVAETPRSVVVRYNVLTSSLAEATSLAEYHCQKHGHDAALQQSSEASNLVVDAQYLCM